MSTNRINRAAWLKQWQEDLSHAWSVGVNTNGHKITQQTEAEFIEACWLSFDESQTDDILNNMEMTQ